MNDVRAPNLALVLARGGSKSVPRKNLALVAGKPLIAWTVEAALACPEAGRVVVSTDDPEIAEVARTLGAETPFARPVDLARDDTPTMPVVMHALEALHAEAFDPAWVLLLQPTSPLRTADDIAAAFRLASKRGDSVVSVTPAASHPNLMKRITPDGWLEDYFEHATVERRQDLEPVYSLNGAIYLATREHLMRARSFYSDHTYAYVMPPERSIDVDSEWDLHLCDLILKDAHARD